MERIEKKRITIHEAFPESEMTIFRQECKKKNIKYVDEITGVLLWRFPGLVISKIKVIEQRVKDILEHDESIIYSVNQSEEPLSIQGKLIVSAAIEPICPLAMEEVNCDSDKSTDEIVSMTKTPIEESTSDIQILCENAVADDDTPKRLFTKLATSNKIKQMGRYFKDVFGFGRSRVPNSAELGEQETIADSIGSNTKDEPVEDMLGKDDCRDGDQSFEEAVCATVNTDNQSISEIVIFRQAAISDKDCSRDEIEIFPDVNQEYLSEQEIANEQDVSDDRVTIDEAFPESGMKIFRTGCKERGINYIDQISGDSINLVYSFYGIGITKIRRIKERINELMRCEKQVNDNENKQSSYSMKEGELPAISTEFMISFFENFEKAIGNIHADFHSKLISDLLVSEVHENEWTRKLKDNYLMCVGDLVAANISELYSILDVVDISQLYSLVKKLKFSPKADFIEKWELIKQDKNYNVLTMRAAGMTLESVGIEVGLTRERIRQKELKIADRILKFIQQEQYRQVLFNRRKAIFRNDLIELLGCIEEAEEIFYVIEMRNNNYFLQNEKFGLMFIDDKAQKLFDDKIKETIRRFGSFCEYLVCIEILSELFESFSIDFSNQETIDRFIKALGYIKIGKYVSSSRLNKREKYGFILRECFPTGIRIYEANDLAIFRSHLYRLFHEEDYSTERSISAILADVGLLFDRGEYIHPDDAVIADDVLEDILTFIERSDFDSVTINDLFAVFEDRLIEKSVTNRYYLHGLLRNYCGEGEYSKLSFTKDVITKSGVGKKSFRVLLAEFLVCFDGPITKEEILSKFPGASNIMIAQAEVSVNEIVTWGYGLFNHCKNLFLSDEELRLMKIVIDDELDRNGGYTNSYIMYSYFLNSFHDVMLRINIDSHNKLFYTLQHHFRDQYNFCRPHILLRTITESFSNSKAIKFLLREKMVFSVSDVQNIVKNNKLNDQSIYSFFADYNDELIYIDYEKLVWKDSLEGLAHYWQQIDEYMNGLVERDKYILIDSFNDFDLFPYVGFEWNEFLLESVLSRFAQKVKIIQPPSVDRRSVRSIAVSRRDEFEKYEDVIRYILRLEYSDKGFSSREDLESELRKRGLFIFSFVEQFFEEGFLSYASYINNDYGDYGDEIVRVVVNG